MNSTELLDLSLKVLFESLGKKKITSRAEIVELGDLLTDLYFT